MIFADQIATAPIPFNREKGATAAAPFAGLPGAATDLIAGAAGCAPYLARLIGREGDWLAETLVRAPEDTLQATLADIATAEPNDLGPALRAAKRRVALLTALADLGGVWDLAQVTTALSDLADTSLNRSIAVLTDRARASGKLPQGDGAGGFFVLAMGKLGSRELNYSSDIDLVLLFDESRYPPADYMDIRQTFIRIGRQLLELIGKETRDGYVFRMDLRLRPDPSSTPIVLGAGGALRYYEAEGRTWERAAFIRARAAAGDVGAGAAFLEDLSPFIWRRHLDFAAIQEAHDCVPIPVDAAANTLLTLNAPTNAVSIGTFPVGVCRTKWVLSGAKRTSEAITSTGCVIP